MFFPHKESLFIENDDREYMPMISQTEEDLAKSFFSLLLDRAEYLQWQINELKKGMDNEIF